jgi:hypothetical protein
MAKNTPKLEVDKHKLWLFFAFIVVVVALAVLLFYSGGKTAGKAVGTGTTSQIQEGMTFSSFYEIYKIEVNHSSAIAGTYTLSFSVPTNSIVTVSLKNATGSTIGTATYNKTESVSRTNPLILQLNYLDLYISRPHDEYTIVLSALDHYLNGTTITLVGAPDCDPTCASYQTCTPGGCVDNPECILGYDEENNNLPDYAQCSVDGACGTCAAGMYCQDGFCNNYICQGSTFANATLCPRDDVELPSSTQNKLVNSCTSDMKCEYVCNTNFELNITTNTCQAKACTPECTGKNCGESNGCGGTCPGSCLAANQECSNNVCVFKSACEFENPETELIEQYQCGPGSSAVENFCGTCPADKVCQNGACVAALDCTNSSNFNNGECKGQICDLTNLHKKVVWTYSLPRDQGLLNVGTYGGRSGCCLPGNCGTTNNQCSFLNNSIVYANGVGVNVCLGGNLQLCMSSRNGEVLANNICNGTAWKACTLSNVNEVQANKRCDGTNWVAQSQLPGDTDNNGCYNQSEWLSLQYYYLNEGPNTIACGEGLDTPSCLTQGEWLMLQYYYLNEDLAGTNACKVS